ncbi:MAG: polyprenyl synthetase family protein [Saprospirales bacterium]|nr:MAG: polyprenyl synthetase family protein [Saprospirales bacterium]
MELINKFKTVFEKTLQEYLREVPQKPSALYDGLKHILESDAKRLRPAAVLLGCYLYDENFERALPVALAIEIFHNFTLVHDDIMDEAEIRRGRPSVHKKYGSNIAIMVGDVMVIQAFRIMLALDEEVDIDLVLDLFCDTATRICEGQVLDMEFESRKEVRKEEYLEMVGLKTAVLLGLSFQIGAIVAGKEEEETEFLFQFGYNVGVAFQIMDDWIDAFGDSNQTGKKQGGDIRQKKKTWLWFVAIDLAEQEDRNFLIQLMEQDTVEESDVKRVLELYELYDVAGETMAFANQLLEQSLAEIQQSNLSADKKELMTDLARRLVERDF